MAETKNNVDELLNAFAFDGEFAGISRIPNGHINDTFVFIFKGDNCKETKYIVQQINTNTFKEPVKLMNNMVGVTSFLRKKIEAEGGNPERESLCVFYAKDGKPYFVDSEGNFWRCLNFIDDAHSEDICESAEMFKKAAKAFGKFQCQLADYPIDSLAETIPNFHNTVSRFADFKKAVEDNISSRLDTCKNETEFVLSREKDCGVLIDLLNNGDLPLRVTHNDTKLNNVMMDNKTGEGICVVDLDTVMPGLSLYDFGDAIRSGANTAAEDEKDLEKVEFSLEYFKAYVEGYLGAAGTSLTGKEIDCLAFSAKLLTLECGMRFLGDYLNGDTYFKTEYPEHNLIRSRTQFKLVSRMEEHMEEMEQIVKNVCSELNI